MKSSRTGLRRIQTAVLVLLGCASVMSGWAGIDEQERISMSDAVLIQTVEQFGPRERPPVVFRHDRHTDALAAFEKDCASCHYTAENRLSLKFLRLKDTGREALMDTYHENCIGCHREMSEKKRDAGPTSCGECHRESAPIEFDRDPMGFDQSLHYRHAKAADNQCGSCHHEFDKTAEKTVYVKGREGTCRYCHQSEDTDTGMRFQTAAHLACIDCHMKKARQKKQAGPVQCRGCHDASEKENIIQMDDIPRLERNQPDTVFVKRYDRARKVSASEYRMPLVPFDHRQHETRENTCRVCHHAGLESCNTCHGMAGLEKGDWIKLERAMHDPDEKMSCTGCHRTMTGEKQCAGCHARTAAKPGENDAYCNRCHRGTVKENQDPTAMVLNESLAKQLLSAGKTTAKQPLTEKIPKTVTINILEDKYKPVEFPHGRIVQTLMQGISDNGLAEYFHNGPGRMCRGCHHNSPASAPPPRCGSCHGKPFDKRNPLVPGLMGAYHQQCMACHENMGMAKPAATDCTACHEEKM